MSEMSALDRRVIAQSIKAAPVDGRKAEAFVDAVGTEIVAAMGATDHAVASVARCIATFVEERSAMNMPLALGLDEMDLAAAALTSQLQARRDTTMLKLALWRLPPQIGVTGWGSWCPCEEKIDGTPADR